MHDSPFLTHPAPSPDASPDPTIPADAPRPGWANGWLFAILICIAFFAATAPTLHRLEFFDGVEHINFATVLELRRDGGPRQWLMPELEADPRTVKPPLTAWITAAPVRQATVRDLGRRDPAVRGAAFSRFVWECRWPTLLCSCLLLLATYELGRILGGRGRRGDWQVGVLAVLICASCLLLLRQGRRATTDLQLALWVTVANAFLARLIVERRVWNGCLGAGVALGLAIMSKGPHIAFLQTVVPAGLFALLARSGWRGEFGGNETEPTEGAKAEAKAERNRIGFLLPVFTGAVLALVIGLWWYGYVLIAVPGVWNTWFHEVTRVGANAMKPDPWYQYVTFLRWMLPWTAWMLLGLGYSVYELLAYQAAPKGPRPADRPEGIPAPNSAFALLLLLVPLVVMSFFRERKERYLLPMVGPAAVLAARALAFYLRDIRAGGRAALLPRVVDAITWVSVAVLAVGLPILGATHRKSFLSADGKTPWFTPAVAVVAASLAAGLLLAGFLASRRWQPAGVVAIVLAAWLGSEMQLRGYAAGDDDGRPQQHLAEELWQQYPDAIVYGSESPTRYGNLSLPAIVLSIYFDRVVFVRPEALPTEPGVRPVVLLTEASEEKPPPVPEGWKRLDALRVRSRGRQYVDVLAR